jgi:hypothetical protein
VNVHMSTRFSHSIGGVWGKLQAWQNAMILVAPMVGSVVLDALDAGWLFVFSAGVAVFSFDLFYFLRTLGRSKLQASAAS